MNKDEKTIKQLQKEIQSLKRQMERMKEDHEDELENIFQAKNEEAHFVDHWGYDDYDSGMSHRQQCYADRSDYARELYEKGEICEIQMQEMRMGA
jgi:hypothetical protein